jgi:hypothetical protein
MADRNAFVETPAKPRALEGYRPKERPEGGGVMPLRTECQATRLAVPVQGQK